jgi:predicted nuclease with TOPRIM domain
MEQTVERLRRRVHQLNNDLVTITEILELNPDSITKLRPKLASISEAIEKAHTLLHELEPEDPPA